MLRFDFQLMPYIMESIALCVMTYWIVRKGLLSTKRFQLARNFLLIGIVISHLFPVLVFSFGIELFRLTPNILLPKFEQTSTTPGISMMDWALYLYLAISILLLARLAYRIIRNVYIIKQGKELDEGSHIYIHSAQGSPFSFLSYICLPRGYDQLHLVHEQLHVWRNHTFDLLLIEALKCLFWYNPMLYKCTDLMKEIHEYQVDDDLIRLHLADKRTYCELIVDSYASAYQLKIIHTFHSLIKNRITMINQNPVQKKPFVIYGSIASFAFLSFFLSIEKQNILPNYAGVNAIVADSIPTRDLKYFIQQFGMEKVVSTDTIIDFDYDTKAETIKIVKSEMAKGPYMYLQYLLAQDPVDQKKVNEIMEKYR